MKIHVDQYVPDFFVGFKPELNWETDTSLLFDVVDFIANQKNNPNFIRYMISYERGILDKEHALLMVELKDETNPSRMTSFVIAFLTPIEAAESLNLPEFK